MKLMSTLYVSLQSCEYYIIIIRILVKGNDKHLN